jgi:hypothetical protein
MPDYAFERTPSKVGAHPSLGWRLRGAAQRES